MPDQVINPDARGERKIGIGEIGVLTSTGMLRTLLGSCIGLVLHDNKNRVGGMAHIMLPSSNGTEHPAGKYANLALPELIRQITTFGGQSKGLIAKLAGGARMFATEKSQSIGDQNLMAVEQLLKDSGIPIHGRHCGGTKGRRMSYNVATGAVVVEVVGCEIIEL